MLILGENIPLISWHYNIYVVPHGYYLFFLLRFACAKWGPSKFIYAYSSLL